MRWLIVMAAAIIVALAFVISAYAGGYIAWQSNRPCQGLNVYQYGDGAYRNVWNGSGYTGQFYAPYPSVATGYCHYGGQTRNASSGPGGFMGFTF